MKFIKRLASLFSPGSQSKETRPRARSRMLMVIAPLAAVAAFAVVPAMASAAPPEFEEAGTLFPLPFHSHALPPGPEVLKTVGGLEVQCKNQTNVGTIIDSKNDDVTVTFTECEALGSACTSEGAENPGEILVHAKTYIVDAFTSSGSKVVADLLYPETEVFPPKQPGEEPDQITAFNCLLPVTVRGSVIGKFDQAKLGLAENSTTLTFAQGATEGEQALKEYETPTGAKRAANLEANILGFEEAAQETEDEITLDNGAKVKITGP